MVLHLADVVAGVGAGVGARGVGAGVGADVTAALQSLGYPHVPHCVLNPAAVSQSVVPLGPSQFSVLYSMYPPLKLLEFPFLTTESMQPAGGLSSGHFPVSKGLLPPEQVNFGFKTTHLPTLHRPCHFIPFCLFISSVKP